MMKVGLLAYMMILMAFLLPGSSGDEETGLNALERRVPWSGLLNSGFQKIRIKFSHKKSSKSTFKHTKQTFHHYTGKK